MKNITLALAIALGFCAIEAGSQERTLQGKNQASVKRLERKLPDDLRAKMTLEEIRDYELWSTWPDNVGPLRADIVKKCGEEFNVVFLGEGQNEWMKGCGKCLIDSPIRGEGRLVRDFSVRCVWKKFNSDGVLIQAGSCKNFNEYIWMTNRANCVTIENRKKWASEHSMSYEDAVLRREAYFDALQARKEAVERAEREKEREETQKNLTEMAEELKRQREESAAVKKGE